MSRAVTLFVLLAALTVGLRAAESLRASRFTPNLVDNIDRPLRYRPDGADFVIENGTEFFNRALYGGNTAFRVDGGDRPEFVLYLPGRGGNLRLGIATRLPAARVAGIGDPGPGAASPASSHFVTAKWLHEAERIVTRYRPGELLYEIQDQLLGAGATLRLAAVARADSEGLIVRAEWTGPAPLTPDAPLELVFAYGGVNGQRGKRDGDIGTESVPISQWFQLQPEFCRGNEIDVARGRFLLRAKPATILGLSSVDAQLAIADAANWEDLPALLDTAKGAAQPELPVLVGRAPLAAGQPLFIGLQRLAADAKSAAAEDLDTYREVTAPRATDSELVAARGRPTPPQSTWHGQSARADRNERGQVDRATARAEANERPAPKTPSDNPPGHAEKPGGVRAGDLPRLFAHAERHFRELRQRVSVETPDPFLDAAVGALNVAADAAWDAPQQAIMHGAIAWRTKLLGWRGAYALDALGWHERFQRNFASWASRQNTDPIPPALPPADENANLARNEAGLHSNGDMSNSHYDMNLVAIDALFRHLRWTGDLAFAEQMWPVIERHLAWERRLFRRQFGPERLPLYEAYAAIWASDDLQYHGGGVMHASVYNYYHNVEAARLARRLGRDPAPYEREAELLARGMRELLWLPERGHFAEYKDLLGLQRVHPSAALWTFYHSMDSAVPTPQEAWSMTRQVETEIPHLPVRGPGVPAGLHVLSTTNWMPYTWSINNVVLPEVVHTALGFWQAGRPEEAWTMTKGALLAAMFMGIAPGNVGSMSYLDVYRRESQRDFADSSGVLSRALVEGLFGLQPDLLAGELRVEPGFPAAWDRASLRHPDVSLRFERAGDADHYVITQRFAQPQALRLVLIAPRDRVGSLAVNGDGAEWQVVEDSVGAPRIVITSPPGFRHEVLIEWAGEAIGSTRGKAGPAVGGASAGNATATHESTRAGCPCHDGQRSSPGAAIANSFIRAEQGQMRWQQPVGSAQQANPCSRAGDGADREDQPRGHEIRGPARERRDQSGEHPVVLDPAAPAAGQFSESATNRQRDATGCTLTPVAADARIDCVDLTPHFNDRVTQIFRHEYRSPRSPFVSLAIPKQGIGGWAGSVNATAEIDDSGLRRAADANGGRILLPNGVALATPGFGRATGNVPARSDRRSGAGATPAHGQDARATTGGPSHGQDARATPNNVLFVSLWDNYPDAATVPLDGRAQRVLLLLAGSTNHMQSRFENGEIEVRYTDGTSLRLPLENPTNWWPIEQDYFIDDFQFHRPEPLPVRVDLKTGEVRALTFPAFKGRGGRIPGGAATVLELPLDATKDLQSLTVRALANEVVIGLMAATLVR